MAGPDTIPDLNYQKPDGSLFTRLEMEEQMRKVWPKIHWIRIKANKIYGLPRQAAFDMKEAILRHWTLDEMIRRGQITGDSSGVDAQTYNDDATTRQFIQRLQYLVQAGQAITPQEGEGVDMSQFVPPPPPMGGSNGAPQQQQMPFQPPMPQQGYAPPQMPQQPPMPPGPPQQMMAPPMAPPQQMMPQGPPQQQFAPPMPGAGMPQMPSTPVPPMPGAPPPQMPQQQAAPQGGGRRKRGGGDQQAQAPQPAAPVPQMPQQGFQPQGQFAPPGAPPPMMPPGGQQGYAPPPQQQQAPQGASTYGQQQVPQQQAAPAATDPALHQKLDQILANQARLTSDLGAIQAGIAVALRATYQRPGEANLRAFLAELNIQLPQ